MTSNSDDLEAALQQNLKLRRQLGAEGRQGERQQRKTDGRSARNST